MKKNRKLTTIYLLIFNFLIFSVASPMYQTTEEVYQAQLIQEEHIFIEQTTIEQLEQMEHNIVILKIIVEKLINIKSNEEFADKQRKFIELKEFYSDYSLNQSRIFSNRRTINSLPPKHFLKFPGLLKKYYQQIEEYLQYLKNNPYNNSFRQKTLFRYIDIIQDGLEVIYNQTKVFFINMSRIPLRLKAQGYSAHPIKP